MKKSPENRPFTSSLARYKAIVYQQYLAPILCKDEDCVSTVVSGLLTQSELKRDSSLANPLREGLWLDPKDTYWYKEKISYYEQYIIYLELMISDVNRHCHKIESPFRVSNEKFIAFYQSLVRHYEAQLNQAYLMRKQLQDRL
jgi:hypothetical protein